MLIVFSKEDLKNGIEEGGRVMNPLDRNVVDKMAVLGIIPLPVDILSLQKNIEQLSRQSFWSNISKN